MSNAKAFIILALLAACDEAAPRIESVAAPKTAGSISADPALAVDSETGDVLMTWVAGDSTNYHVYFARSSDGGDNWSTPVRVTQLDNDVKPHGQASPRIVAAPGAIAVFWPNHIAVPGRRFAASHLRFSRSTDGGRTWEPTVTINDDTTSALAGHTFHGAVLVPPSTIAVAWLDSRSNDSSHLTATESHEHAAHDGDATIYMAVSKDLGASWSMNNTKLWGDACPCCRVSLAARADKKIVAAWRSHMSGDVRDPVVALVTDRPAPPVRVHADNWVFAGCPHTGPALNVSNEGAVQVAWYNGDAERGGIYYSESPADSLAFAPPVQIVGGALPAAHPAVAVAGDKVFVAYDVDAAGTRVLSFARIADGRSRSVSLPDSDGADHPQIVAFPEGGALVAWTQKRGTSSEIRLATLK